VIIVLERITRQAIDLFLSLLEELWKSATQLLHCSFFIDFVVTVASLQVVGRGALSGFSNGVLLLRATSLVAGVADSLFCGGVVARIPNSSTVVDALRPIVALISTASDLFITMSSIGEPCIKIPSRGLG
jgi:predicted neutral ceramidase superfamily lipid hydrolase